MILKIIFALLVLFLVYRILRGLYFNWVYPLCQSLKRKNEFGYVITKNGEFEHRLVVQRIIKRSLEYGEEVHHINGRAWDNKRSNLALMTRENHQRWHQRLNWMYERNMFPKIAWQRSKLRYEFDAVLF